MQLLLGKFLLASYNPIFLVAEQLYNHWLTELLSEIVTSREAIAYKNAAKRRSQT